MHPIPLACVIAPFWLLAFHLRVPLQMLMLFLGFAVFFSVCVDILGHLLLMPVQGSAIKT